MLIKATDKPLRIDFRVEGKVYSENMEAGHFDSANRTTYPFDSATIQVGETWDSKSHDGAKETIHVIRIVELGGNAQETEQTAP